MLFELLCGCSNFGFNWWTRAESARGRYRGVIELLHFKIGISSSCGQLCSLAASGSRLERESIQYSGCLGNVRTSLRTQFSAPSDSLLQFSLGVQRRVFAFVGDFPETHGRRKLRRRAPTSSRDGALSRGFSRLTNAFHCSFFWGSFRNASVSAKGTVSGMGEPRRSNEARIALPNGAISNVQVLAISQTS
jgi:hypothetical protein